MTLIKNFRELAKNPLRKTCLEIIDAGLSSIQPKKIVQENFSLKKNILTIQDRIIDLKKFERIFLLGFGKGSAVISKRIERMLGNFLNKGYVIDIAQEKFTNIEFTQGTHPLPSRINFILTKRVLDNLINLTKNDLLLVVIAGGGSALFENPYKISLEKLIEVNKSLLLSGANIIEMNIVRKHLSLVKGGALAKYLYPAKIVSIVASDVPGNDLSVIASGPTVKDETTKEEALQILKKYNLLDKLNLSLNDFLETPKDDNYFKNTLNILLLSNQTALLAMRQKAKELGFNVKILSDKLQGEAKFVGKMLIEKTLPHTALLVGGETTVKVLNKDGLGGRNQELVLAALPYIDKNSTIASFDSDGWDNSPFAGAIGDFLTIQRAKTMNINPKIFLQENNSFSFFEKTEDGIITDHLPSNVSDLMIVLKN